MKAFGVVCLNRYDQKDAEHERHKKAGKPFPHELADGPPFERKRRTYSGQSKERGHEPGPDHVNHERGKPERPGVHVKPLPPVVVHHEGMKGYE